MNERIKQIRIEHNLSQIEFGKRLGISDAAVSKIESGKNNPAETTIKLICREFDIEYQWLMYGTGPKSTHDMTVEDLVEKHMPEESEFTKSIMKAFAKLPDTEWTTLMKLVNEINGLREKEGRP